MKLNLRLKIIVSVILIGCLGIAFYYVSDQGNDTVITDDVIGEIEFKLFDQSQSLVVDDRLSIYEGDTLFTILSRHYDLVCANQHFQADDTCAYKFVYGYALLGIEDIMTNWYGSYLSVFINEQLAVEGVSLIEPQDGDLIEIKVISGE